MAQAGRGPGRGGATRPATHKRSEKGLGAARKTTAIASTLARDKNGLELRHLVLQ